MSNYDEMNPPTDPNFLCCEWSAAVNEPLRGTAVTANVWFMLEYTRPWGAKATEENELPGDVLKWLSDQVSAVNGRLQFIRQFRPDADVLTFFVGVNDEIAPRLYEFHLGDYADLLELDVTAVVAGDGRYNPHLVTGQRYFVCTNGKRDRSCAVYGAALYRALAEKVGTAVWQTTHLGGHRFAGTLLALPDGACYGRLSAKDSTQLLANTQRGSLWLEKLRGRTCYNTIAQIADFYLRQETGRHQLEAFQLVGMEEVPEGAWQVAFQAKDHHTYQITITTADPLPIYANSGQLKTKKTPQYQLLNIVRRA
jgi:hypothetical protein